MDMCDPVFVLTGAGRDALHIAKLDQLFKRAVCRPVAIADHPRNLADGRHIATFEPFGPVQDRACRRADVVKRNEF